MDVFGFAGLWSESTDKESIEPTKCKRNAFLSNELTSKFMEKLFFESFLNKRSDVFMSTIIDVLMKILEVLQARQTKNKVKAEIGTLGEHYKNKDNLHPEVAHALDIKHSEIVFQDIFQIETKAHLFGQINDIYDNSELSRPQIKSGFRILRQTDGRLQHGLGTLEWIIGKAILIVGYGMIWAGIFLAPLISLLENEPSAIDALFWVIKCWVIGFPLMFFSLPFYNASLIGKYLAKKEGLSVEDADYYRLFFGNCKTAFMNKYSSCRNYYTSKLISSEKEE